MARTLACATFDSSLFFSLSPLTLCPSACPCVFPHRSFVLCFPLPSCSPSFSLFLSFFLPLPTALLCSTFSFSHTLTFLAVRSYLDRSNSTIVLSSHTTPVLSVPLSLLVFFSNTLLDNSNTVPSHPPPFSSLLFHSFSSLAYHSHAALSVQLLLPVLLLSISLSLFNSLCLHFFVPFS